MPSLDSLCADLGEEHRSLDLIVGGLGKDAWALPTPAEGWDVMDQVGHLAYFDAAALRAVGSPEEFEAEVAAARDPIADGVVATRSMEPDQVLAWWRGGSAAMLDRFGELQPHARIPWYGPPMGAASFITARIMETWAHGQDIADALGIERTPSDRLRHVAHMGVVTMAYCHALNGLEPPSAPVRVELTAPSGDTWGWGEPGQGELVSGPALDFCLVVTRRRHIADTKLVVGGEQAGRWMTVAQAFAGPAGSGRRPGQFPRQDP